MSPCFRRFALSLVFLSPPVLAAPPRDEHRAAAARIRTPNPRPDPAEVQPSEAAPLAAAAADAGGVDLARAAGDDHRAGRDLRLRPGPSLLAPAGALAQSPGPRSARSSVVAGPRRGRTGVSRRAPHGCRGNAAGRSPAVPGAGPGRTRGARRRDASARVLGRRTRFPPRRSSGAALYVIARGTVEISVETTTGKKVVLGQLGPGDFFGELSLLDGRERTADALALEPTGAMGIDREALEGLFRKHPGAALDVLTVIGKRLREADRLLQTASSISPNQESSSRRPRSSGWRSGWPRSAGTCSSSGCTSWSFSPGVLLNVGLSRQFGPSTPFPSGS